MSAYLTRYDGAVSLPAHTAVFADVRSWDLPIFEIIEITLVSSRWISELFSLLSMTQILFQRARENKRSTG